MTGGDYAPLSAYGLVGNAETCALVSRRGSIDWLPLPHLADASVFAAILDADEGGRFAVRPTTEFEGHQRYRPRTNVLETEFDAEGGSAVLTDFMPILSTDPEAPVTEPWLFRRIECTDGELDLEVIFEPRFDYARARTIVEPTVEGVLARGNGEHVSLSTGIDVETDTDIATGSVRLSGGETRWITLQYGLRKRPISVDPADLLARTEEFWRGWVHDCESPTACPFGRWHDAVERSELVLKLLMHHRTGAIAAAPTTSLPETIGGTRNWDYRFSWLRDAAYTVRALSKVGHTREAEDYLDWFLDVIHDDGETGALQPFQPLYGLHGERDTREEVLDHLSGYRGSEPVRIGNAASNQLQLDIYGELVLSVAETLRHGRSITDVTWETIREIVEFVSVLWHRRDQGLWEVRSESEHFVHSKVMCWVALDRAVRMARERGDDDAPVDRWVQVREEIRDVVLTRGFDEEVGSFLRSFEADGALDAATLRIPLVGFLPMEDPRVQGTIDAIRERLATEEGFVYRYQGDDGLPGEEGAFLLTTLWLVNCLALSGRVEEAERILENVMNHASPHGLLAEEVDPETGELRGNYPQAFSHLEIINSVTYLDAGKRDDPVDVPGVDARDAGD